MSDSTNDEFRRIRAEIFAGVFDRIVWLDAAALSAVLASLTTSIDPSEAPSFVWGIRFLTIGLVLTLVIPPYRALQNAWHQHSKKFRFLWEAYAVQLVAALMSGLGMACLVAAYYWVI